MIHLLSFPSGWYWAGWITGHLWHTFRHRKDWYTRYNDRYRR